MIREPLSLCLLPSPLHHAPGLSRLAGTDVYLKRDDLLGRVLGGNKLRKLQYIVADAVAQGATALLTTGSFESNHACLTAAVATMLNLRAGLVLMGPKGRAGTTLNERIVRRVGAAVRTVEYDESDQRARAALSARVEQAVAELTGELEAQAPRVYRIPGGGCCPEGSFAFAAAFDELHAQMLALGVGRYRIVLAVGTGSTYAGLLCGARRAGAEVRVSGISIARRNPRCTDETRKAAEALCAATGMEPPPAEAFEIDDAHIGQGYAKPTESSARGVAAALAAEAVPMCHTYAGKALGALLDTARGRPASEPVVFWHTGGVAGAVDGLLAPDGGPS